jgi:hypothetical protein
MLIGSNCRSSSRRDHGPAALAARHHAPGADIGHSRCISTAASPPIKATNLSQKKARKASSRSLEGAQATKTTTKTRSTKVRGNLEGKAPKAKRKEKAKERSSEGEGKEEPTAKKAKPKSVATDAASTCAVMEDQEDDRERDSGYHSGVEEGDGMAEEGPVQELSDEHIEAVGRALNIPVHKIKATLHLRLLQGNTVPFITRYRQVPVPPEYSSTEATLTTFLRP